MGMENIFKTCKLVTKNSSFMTLSLNFTIKRETVTSLVIYSLYMCE